MKVPIFEIFISEGILLLTNFVHFVISSVVVSILNAINNDISSIRVIATSAGFAAAINFLIGASLHRYSADKAVMIVFKHLYIKGQNTKFYYYIIAAINLFMTVLIDVLLFGQILDCVQYIIHVGEFCRYAGRFINVNEDEEDDDESNEEIQYNEKLIKNKESVDGVTSVNDPNARVIRFCRHCGHAMSEVSAFCNSCGVYLANPKKEFMFCRKCGKKISVDSDYCEYCGEKQILLKQEDSII